MIKHKSKPIHRRTVPTLYNGIDRLYLVELPDGRTGDMYFRGTLDVHDGLFYPDPQGLIAKVDNLEGCLYAYIPVKALKINSFGIGISWR